MNHKHQNSEFDQPSWAAKIFLYLELMENLSRSDVAFDFKCGDGFGSKMLASKAKSVVGADTNIELIEKNKLRYRYDNLTFEIIEGETLPFAKLTFSYLVSLDTITKSENAKNLLSELKRISKKQATFAFSIKNKNALFPWDININKDNLWSIQEFQDLVSSYFSDIQVYGQMYTRYVNQEEFKVKMAKKMEFFFHNNLVGRSKNLKDKVMKSLINKDLSPSITDFKLTQDYDSIDTKCGEILVVCRN